jgi:hypothetical protein
MSRAQITERSTHAGSWIDAAGAAARDACRALRAYLLRRACQAARAEMRAIGDARLGAIDVNRQDLVATIDALERAAEMSFSI